MGNTETRSDRDMGWIGLLGLAGLLGLRRKHHDHDNNLRTHNAR
jgi:MYXO-CTERM domain-containing protein